MGFGLRDVCVCVCGLLESFGVCSVSGGCVWMYGNLMIFFIRVSKYHYH